MNEMIPAMHPGSARESTTPVPRFDQGIFLMHLNRGRKLFEARRLDEARAELEQAIHLRPRDEMTLNLLGMVYFKLDMRPDAASVYRRLLELHPEADVLHSNLGVLEFKNARYDDARRRLETALLLNPRNPRPHLYLGLIEKVEGNAEECLRHLEAAGAGDLIERLRIGRVPDAVEQPGSLHDDADTGPMAPIDLEQRVPLSGLDLRRWLDARTDGSALSLEGEETVFTVSSTVGPAAADTLEILFSREILVRSGSVLHLQAAASSLRAAAPDPSGMIALRGDGRLELSPSSDLPGRVMLVEMSAGLDLHVGAGRLLAREAGIETQGIAADRDPSPMVGRILRGALRLAGEGIVAISMAPTARAHRMAAGDLLLVPPRDLVCWSGGLRVRPASMGPVERILVPCEGLGAVTLEGAGEAIIESPA